MFLLRARNNYGEEKKKVYQVKRFPCLYISSVEMLTDLREDVSVLKKTVDRTVSNLNLKALTGEPVLLVLNENGIIIQENRYKDSQANSVLMAHALKRICYTTSYPKKKIYVFVSRLPQEERVFAHFFLMQDKSSGDKIIKELSNLFTNAFKDKKRKTLEKDKRRNLRADNPVSAPAPAPQHQKPTKVQASPKKGKDKSNPPLLNQFAPPPPYVDVTANQDVLFQEFDIISPLNIPTAPPFSPEQNFAQNNFAGAEAFPPGYGFLPQVPTFDTPPQQATPAYYPNDPFLPQPEKPRYIEDPFAPQRANFNPIDVQDPFSAFQMFPQSPNHVPSSALEASDGLPSYNSYREEFQAEPIVSRDDLLIDFASPDHLPTTRLMRSLSTSNMLDEVRSDSPPFLPPTYISSGSPEVPLPPSQSPQAATSAFRCLGVPNGSPARPKSGIYPSLSSGLERERTSMLAFEADDFEHNAISYNDEHFELANEPWYQEGLPRNIIVELLRDQKEGAFFIRESLSQPGKLALSVKASTSVTHFLIIKSKKGYHVENDKIFFPSISLLVMHHSINRGVLPCTLTVADSNPTYLRSDHLESSDSEAEGEDPIYTTHALTDSMNVHQH